MKTAIYFLSVCLALCLAACNNQNEPEPTPDHQPANPKTFSLAGKMYVGDSKTVTWLADGWYSVIVFTKDSIKMYDTTNTDFSPLADVVFTRNTSYTLKYPTIEINYFPWPEEVTMPDTLTIDFWTNIHTLH